MVKVRLTRGGAKKRPFYHIVVTDQRNKRDGRAIERLGFYNPVAQGNEPRLVLDAERVKYWVGVGAQMTAAACRRRGLSRRRSKPAVEDRA